MAKINPEIWVVEQRLDWLKTKLSQCNLDAMVLKQQIKDCKRALRILHNREKVNA